MSNKLFVDVILPLLNVGRAEGHYDILGPSFAP